MTVNEILERMKEIYKISINYLGKHTNMSAFIAGCVVGLISGILVS